MRKYNKTLVSLFIVLGLFFTLLSLLSLSYVLITHGDSVTGPLKIFVTYHIHFMIVLGFLGVMTGLISYKGFNQQHKEVVHSKEISKDILMRFLDGAERQIINTLLERSTTIITQAHISKLDNMGKVKAHRTIQRLEKKNIITLTPYGKTKQLVLDDSIIDLLEN